MSKEKKSKEVEVVAYRRICASAGENTGLSHYIFTADEPASKTEAISRDDKKPN